MKRLLGMGAVLLCLCLAAGCVAAEDRKTPGYYDFPNTTGIGSAPSATSAAITTTTSTTNPLQSELDELRSRLSALEATTTTAKASRPPTSSAGSSASPTTTSTQGSLPQTTTVIPFKEIAVELPAVSTRVQGVDYMQGNEVYLPKEGRQYAILTLCMQAHVVPQDGNEFYSSGDFLRWFHMSDGRRLNANYDYGIGEDGWLYPDTWITFHIYKQISADAHVTALTFVDVQGEEHRSTVSLTEAGQTE